MWWPWRRRARPKPPPPLPRSIDEMYRSYAHVIRVDPRHIPWRDRDAFLELRRWARINHCGAVVDRVIWDQWQQRWEENQIGGTDQVFLGTNDEGTAMLARLTWGEWQ